MRIQLSDHFTFRKLMSFTIPSIIMMVFTSVYGVVDGIFVSNYAGKTPFAALNLIFPFVMVFGAIGFMLGTGGTALIAKTLGQKNKEKANKYFSMLIYSLFLIGSLCALIGYIFVEDIAVWLGAEGDMITYCITYGRIVFSFLPAFMLQNAFQAFFVTAEKPKLGLAFTVAAGLTNIALDYLFIAVFDWGLKGAALATGISQSVGGLLPLIYFAIPNSSRLRLTGPYFSGRAFAIICSNGSSELVTNISMSVVTMLYNFQLMKFIGEDGVAAFGVICYVNFIFISVFLGYSIGSAPLVSYNFGAKNNDELKNLLRKSLIIIAGLAVLMTTMAECLAGPLSSVFVGYDDGLYELTRKAFMIYCLSFLLAGFNIYASAFFTALNNGLISAGISFSRTLIFECGSVLLLPIILGIDGIWYSIIVAEAVALALSGILLLKFRKRYGY